MTKWNLCMVGSTYEKQSKSYTVLDYLSFYNKGKGIYKNSTANIVLNSRRQKLSSNLGQEQNKDVHSHYFYSKLYWKSSQGDMARKRKMRCPDGKGRSEVISVSR